MYLNEQVCMAKTSFQVLVHVSVHAVTLEVIRFQTTIQVNVNVLKENNSKWFDVHKQPSIIQTMCCFHSYTNSNGPNRRLYTEQNIPFVYVHVHVCLVC